MGDLRRRACCNSGRRMLLLRMRIDFVCEVYRLHGLFSVPAESRAFVQAVSRTGGQAHVAVGEGRCGSTSVSARSAIRWFGI